MAYFNNDILDEIDNEEILVDSYTKRVNMVIGRKKLPKNIHDVPLTMSPFNMKRVCQSGHFSTLED